MEVSKPRIVVVLVITAVTSLLGATRFDSTPDIPWDISLWQIGFLTLAGALASMGSSALNHYYDRDIDKIMERTAKTSNSFWKVIIKKRFNLWNNY